MPLSVAELKARRPRRGRRILEKLDDGGFRADTSDDEELERPAARPAPTDALALLTDAQYVHATEAAAAAAASALDRPVEACLLAAAPNGDVVEGVDSSRISLGRILPEGFAEKDDVQPIDVGSQDSSLQTQKQCSRILHYDPAATPADCTVVDTVMDQGPAASASLVYTVHAPSNGADSGTIPKQQTLPNAIRHDHFDVPATIEWIREGGYSRIALQFPDALLGEAVPVSRDIELALEGVQVCIVADTSNGSCCVDEVAARHASCDAIVHYGGLSGLTQKLPVRRVLGSLPLDVGALGARLSAVQLAGDDVEMEAAPSTPAPLDRPSKKRRPLLEQALLADLSPMAQAMAARTGGGREVRRKILASVSSLQSSIQFEDLSSRSPLSSMSSSFEDAISPYHTPRAKQLLRDAREERDARLAQLRDGDSTQEKEDEALDEEEEDDEEIEEARREARKQDDLDDPFEDPARSIDGECAALREENAALLETIDEMAEMRAALAATRSQLAAAQIEVAAANARAATAERSALNAAELGLERLRGITAANERTAEREAEKGKIAAERDAEAQKAREQESRNVQLSRELGETSARLDESERLRKVLQLEVDDLAEARRDVAERRYVLERRLRQVEAELAAAATAQSEEERRRKVAETALSNVQQQLAASLLEVHGANARAAASEADRDKAEKATQKAQKEVRDLETQLMELHEHVSYERQQRIEYMESRRGVDEEEKVEEEDDEDEEGSDVDLKVATAPTLSPPSAPASASVPAPPPPPSPSSGRPVRDRRPPSRLQVNGSKRQSYD